MKQYLKLLEDIYTKGVDKEDRTGTGTRSLFGYQMRFDLSKGFPLVTTKKLHLKSIIHELIWILSGDSNIKYLQDNGVKIWDDWANDFGDLGPVYGTQWRKYRGVKHSLVYGVDVKVVDQVSNVISSIKKNPDSRRHIVSSWNVAQIEEMALPPCHCFYQLYVANGKLSCQLYQRSADCLIGVPFNIASYAILTHMIAQVCDLEVGDFVHTIGDAHIYSNHMEQVELQLTRDPMPLPKLWLNPEIKDIDDFKYEDIKVLDYNSHPHISAPVAV